MGERPTGLGQPRPVITDVDLVPFVRASTPLVVAVGVLGNAHADTTIGGSNHSGCQLDKSSLPVINLVTFLSQLLSLIPNPSHTLILLPLIYSPNN